MERGIPSSMYREHILELYKSPSNFGILENATSEATAYNSICGDEITVQLLIKNKKISNVKFSGSGCVLSMVASSLLTEKIKGMKLESVMKLEKKDILKLLKIPIISSRIKCVLLPIQATKKALK
jgi:nitrogen fixation NifU-like protein